MNNSELIVRTLQAAGVSHGFQVKQVRRRFSLYGTDPGEQERVHPPAHYFGVPGIGHVPPLSSLAPWRMPSLLVTRR